MAQYTGTVKWFNNAKGYGFLGHDGGADVFVHYSSIQTEGYKTLKEGDGVTFDIIQGDKGPQADNVEMLNGKMRASERSSETDNGSAPTSQTDTPTTPTLKSIFRFRGIGASDVVSSFPR